MNRLIFDFVLSLLLLGVAGPSAAADDPPGQVEIRTQLGSIVIELDPMNAPENSSAFVSYIKQRVYEGSSFDFTNKDVISGGKPGPSSTGFRSNGNFVPNPPKPEFKLKHVRGMIGFSRTCGDCNPNMLSNSTQFYITHADAPQDDNNFSLFGRIVQGMDVVDQISAALAQDKNRKISFSVVLKSPDDAGVR